MGLVSPEPWSLALGLGGMVHVDEDWLLPLFLALYPCMIELTAS